MTDEEHLVENIICYIRDKGFDTEVLPEGLKENGNQKISDETFFWLKEMAQYVVYNENLDGLEALEQENDSLIRQVELLKNEKRELNKLLAESESREKELCILAENLKAKLLFNYENIARLTDRSVEEVEKSANEIFLKRSKQNG